MTKEEIEELIGLAAGMGLYDDKNPGKRAVILGKAIKELQQEPCKDAISRQEMLKYFEGWKNQIKYYHPYAKNFNIPYEEAIQRIKDVPPVKCVGSEKPNKCEDTISRKEAISIASIATLSVNQVVTALEKLPSVTPKPKSEWEQDHEILKAYSDGANAVLDKIRAEIDQYLFQNEFGSEYRKEVSQIIDKYKAEGSGEE